MSSKNYIKEYEIERSRLLEELQQIKYMLSGSFNKVYRKCGKKNCRCQSGEGHPMYRIVWLEQGRSKTKSIPEKDIDWILQMSNNYKRYRRIRKKLLELQKDFFKIIDKQAQVVIGDTR
jgi:hypothetical protein